MTTVCSDDAIQPFFLLSGWRINSSVFIFSPFDLSFCFDVDDADRKLDL